MKKNMGFTDRMTRITFAVVIAVLYFSHLISGTLAIVLGIVAAIFVLTSFVSFCPLYTIFRIDTSKKKNKQYGA